MQQIYRKTSMQKCGFNKVALQIYWNHTSKWVFFCINIIAVWLYWTILKQVWAGYKNCLQNYDWLLLHQSYINGYIKFHSFIIDTCLHAKAFTQCTKNEVLHYFFSKCDQNHRKLQIWSYLLRKCWLENFIFCALT